MSVLYTLPRESDPRGTSLLSTFHSHNLHQFIISKTHTTRSHTIPPTTHLPGIGWLVNELGMWEHSVVYRPNKQKELIKAAGAGAKGWGNYLRATKEQDTGRGVCVCLCMSMCVCVFLCV